MLAGVLHCATRVHGTSAGARVARLEPDGVQLVELRLQCRSKLSIDQTIKSNGICLLLPTILHGWLAEQLILDAMCAHLPAC